VRSYVTRPTTMRAITEIPANTPRPMGRTESFFPGIVNPAWEEALAAAAETDEDAAAAAASSPPDVAAFATEVDERLLEVVAVGVGTGDGRTVEAPLTDTAPFTLAVELAVELVEVTELVDDAGTVEAPLTDTAGVALKDPLVLDAELDEVLLDDVVEEVVVVVETVDNVLVICDAPDDPFDDPAPPPLPSDNVHCFTSRTSGCPLTVIGVRVITQVSVTTPDVVFCSDTVVNVTGC